ncbi:MAG: GAF domain-containing protein [candidate division KSB1 bacterium]|nr:GAF domain-containing protein [candidate division KSB1 bacterium]
MQRKIDDRVFCLARIILLIGTFVFYALLQLGYLPLHFRGLGWMFSLFLLWSLILIWAIRRDDKNPTPQNRRLKRILIAASLPIDAGFIIYAAGPTGGINSPFYHASFVLIVFHAYYFPYLIRAKHPRRNIPVTYGAVSSFLVFIGIYLILSLERNQFEWFQFLVSTVFAFILTMTASFLRNQDRENVRRLRRSNELATLYRSIIERVNQLTAPDGKQSIMQVDFQDLAAAIGKNLSAMACEVFVGLENHVFERRGLWVHEQYRNQSIMSLLKDETVIDSHHEFIIKKGQDRSWRVGRYDNLANQNVPDTPLGRCMEPFCEKKEIRNCLFTLILKRIQPGEMAPIGIIRVSNRLDSDQTLHLSGFTEEDEDVVQTVAKEISGAIANYQLQIQLKKIADTERRLRELALKDDLNEIVGDILESIAAMTRCKYAELWIPFEDDFEAKPKLILRAYHPEEGHFAEGIPEEKRCIDVENSVIGRELVLNSKNGGEIFYREDIRKEKGYAWHEFIDRFETHKFMAIPLRRRKEIMGVVCLHPDEDFVNDTGIRNQLLEFADLAAVSLENARYRRRYTQLTMLRKGLDQLLVRDETEFYHNVAKLVRKVIRTEACSIFELNEKKTELVLKGTTDDSPETARKLNKSIFSVWNTTLGRVFLDKRPVMIYGDGKRISESNHFLETTKTPPRAMIAAPIRNSSSEIIAVVRCINKVQERSLVTSAFTKADLELLEITLGIIGALIENRFNIRKLEELNKKRMNFLGSVAHEFTSPLQGIRTTVEYLRKYHKDKKHLKDPEAQFDFLLDEVDFLNYLISNIREEFTRNEAAFQQMPKQEISLFKLVERIQTLLKGQAKEKRLDIKLKGQFPNIHADRFHLEQVVFNLLVNAIKYSHPGGNPIEIICQENANEILLIFRNWGIGVRKDESARIFEMFARGMNAHMGAVTGTGLGLYISKKIMKNMNGDLRLTQLENPTEFTVFLPKNNHTNL